jgi:MFS family permease
MNSNKSRYFQFLLVVLAAGAIFPIIYLRQQFAGTILDVFGITPEQLNIIYTFLGMAFVVGYFPSGVLSDKFSAKKLLVLSLFMVSVGGFLFAQIPSYGFMIAIFILWGTFSVFTFWSSHMKLVKLLAKENEVGRFFGILDGGRGAVEALLALVAAFIFGAIAVTDSIADSRAALIAVIYMYSAVLLVVAILVAIFVKDDKKMLEDAGMTEVVAKKDEGAEKFHLHDILAVLKNKAVILMGLIIFAGYAVTWTLWYYGWFMEANMHIAATTVATVMAIALWMRPVGGILGGFLADRIGREVVVGGAILISCILLVVLSVLPTGTPPGLLFFLVVFLSLFIYMIRGTYWSLLGQCKIDKKTTGVAIGTVSLIGYIPDIVIPLIINVMVSRFGDQGANNAYFIFSAILGVVGVLVIIAFRKITKNNNSLKQESA